MTEGDFADYQEVPEAYFGKLQSVSSEPKSDLDMFKWLMSTMKGYSRAKLLEIVSTSAKFEDLKMLSDEEIKIYYCEGMISAMIANRKKPK